MTVNKVRAALGATLVVLLVVSAAVLLYTPGSIAPTRVVAYFANTNGLFVGDEVRILGVPVGEINAIEPEPKRVKVTFSYDRKYRVPVNAAAVILSPSLVTARAIQLTPVYRGGPIMRSGTVIPEERTAVPVEWDDLRAQLQKLAKTLQPTEPGGVSTLGAFINSSAANLRGQGANIRESVIQLSQTFSALGDHSGDVFGTVKNLSKLVSALANSTDLMEQLNTNLASVTGLLANQPDEVAHATADLHTVIDQVTSFVNDNRESLGTTSDKLASISSAANDSIDDIKQTLHLLPNAFQNYMNIYQPAQSALTGALAINNFASPIQFICGGIQAAARLNSEQSAKLCVQYLAPIIKNRQYNFPPLGQNLFLGASARPNEITYSEDWMRPDYVPPAAPGGPPGSAGSTGSAPLTATQPSGPPMPAEAPAGADQHTDPAQGLRGMMIPHGGS
jgi:phospholipid/cholesterol/gamma-HCH transport system substrate-binding protein